MTIPPPHPPAAPSANAVVACVVYRCSRQDEMYLYVREDLDPATLPEPLHRQAGRLTEVMRLSLGAGRKLARADVASVIARLHETGWYLQLPPEGRMQAHLHFGD